MTPTQEFIVLSRRTAYPGGRKARRAKRRLHRLIYGSGFSWQIARGFAMTLTPVWKKIVQFAPQIADGTKEGA